MGMQYAWPVYTEASGYEQVEHAMVNGSSAVMQVSPDTIDMYRLPLPDGQNLDEAISKGSDIYQLNCIGCHGPSQDGNGPSSVSLDPKPRNLRNKDFMQALSYQREWTSVHKGVPGTAMPPWGNSLSDDQIKDVIAYAFSLTAPPIRRATSSGRTNQEKDMAVQQTMPTQPPARRRQSSTKTRLEVAPLSFRSSTLSSSWSSALSWPSSSYSQVFSTA